MGRLRFRRASPGFLSISVAEVGIDPRALTPKQRQCNGAIKSTSFRVAG